MAHVLPPPDITIVVQDNTTEPFRHQEQEMRELFANHANSADLLEEQAVINDDEGDLKQLGPRPMLPGQTSADSPTRWVHTRLVVAGTGEWITLVLREDNVYVKGYAKEMEGVNGNVIYEITELTYDRESQSWRRPTLFPAEYNAVALPWDLKYNLLLGLGPAADPVTVETELILMLSDPNFATSAIRYLSSTNPETNPQVARRFLAGLTFMLCEFTRMDITIETDDFLLKAWNWKDMCQVLRLWRDSGYIQWKPKDSMLIFGMNKPRRTLEVVQLVLNYKDYHCQSLASYKAKRKLRLQGTFLSAMDDETSSSHRSGKGNRDQKPVGSESTSSQTCTDKGSSAGGEGAPTNSWNSMTFPCRYRVQLLHVSADFTIDHINIYDWHRGQTVYNRDCVDVDVDDKTLVLIGPRRAIGAYGYLAVECFATFSTDYPIREEWDPCSCEEDIADIVHTHEKVVESWMGSLDILYLMIPRAIEAEIEVQLLLGKTGEMEVSGLIKAYVSDYGTAFVILFAEKHLTVHSGGWIILPLKNSLACVPLRPQVKLFIDVDLTLSKDNYSKHVSCNDVVFSTRFGSTERDFADGHRIRVTVNMPANPAK